MAIHGIGGFAVTALLRIPISHYLSFPASIEFVPAIMFAAWFGGIEVGVAVLVLSGVTLWLFFAFGPAVSQPDHLSEVVDLAVFFWAAILILALIHALNNALDTSDKLAREANELQRRTATLFAELQHRVANNLSFVSAILGQERRHLIGDGAANQALAAAEDRIMTMSRIHRRFYEPQHLDEPARNDLQELCSDLIATSGLPVTCRIDTDDTRLSLDQLIPVSLIVCELVTNSLKHAFSERPDGVITIRLRKRDDRSVVLQVADNGCGEHAGNGRYGLGTMIVRRLADQLKAQMTTEVKQGRSVSVVFPMAARLPNNAEKISTLSEQFGRKLRA